MKLSELLIAYKNPLKTILAQYLVDILLSSAEEVETVLRLAIDAEMRSLEASLPEHPSFVVLQKVAAQAGEEQAELDAAIQDEGCPKCGNKAEFMFSDCGVDGHKRANCSKCGKYFLVKVPGYEE